MTQLVDPDHAEAKVCHARHDTRHLGRAVTAEKTVYHDGADQVARSAPVRVSVLHTCVLDGAPVDHEAPVDVREIGRVTLGLRYRGVRCDGSAIEWVEPR